MRGGEDGSSELSVTVARGAYPVHVTPGGLDGLGARAAQLMAPRRCVVVTNPVVGALYLDQAMDSLRSAGFEPVCAMVPDGEAHKHLGTWTALVNELVALRVDRRTPVFALGGGVTGDIAGFAAATVLRGLPFVQVPTTLLAMVDSAVGGKTGVNLPVGKNLVGAFHAPRLVYSALQTLQTLPVRELTAGLGEVVKHAIIGDAALWTALEDSRGLDARLLSTCVLRSCALKADVVMEDERERGRRIILNFGHTVGHGIEAVVNGRIRHGHCVALGMLAETRFAAARGWSPADLPARLEALLIHLGLGVDLPGDVELHAVRAAARHDKKRDRATLRTCAVTRVGAARVLVLSPGEVDEMVGHLNAPAPPGKLIGAVATVEER